MRESMNERRSSLLYPAAVVGVFLVLLVLYWVQLFATYDTMRQQVRLDTFRHAGQTAQALSLQVNTLFRKLDFFSIQLSEQWQLDDRASFDHSVQVAMKAMAPNSLVQVAVADARGDVVYSRLQDGLVVLDPERRVNIADREHFRFHAGNKRSGLYISGPVLGRISNEWTVQFVRGLWKDGVFEGVLALSVSARHLSAALRSTFPSQDDIAAVLRDDGVFIARSNDLDGFLGQSVPADRPFLSEPHIPSGSYEIRSPIDGIERLYTWQRGADYPFVLTVGYGAKQAFATTEHAVQESIWQNALGTFLLLLGTGVLTRMWVLRSRQAIDLKQTPRRLELALKGGRLGAWEWNLAADQLSIDRAWMDQLGLGDSSTILSSTQWLQYLDPLDRSRIQQAMGDVISSTDGVYEAEYRLNGASGISRWIYDRGEVVDVDKDGRAIQMVGIKQDITRRKLAEQAELALRDQLRKLVAYVPGAVIQFKRSPDGTYSFPFASPGLRAIYELDPEDVVKSADVVFKVIHPSDLDHVRRTIESSARSLQEWRCDYRALRSDGSVRWISGHSRPERLVDGSVLWHGYLQDVTAEREIADALRASEAHLRLTMQAVRDGLWSYDYEARLIRWDERILEMLGYSAEQWQTPTLDAVGALIHPQDRARVSQQVVEIFNSDPHGVIWMDLRLLTSDGRWLWVQARSRIVEWSESGSPKRAVGTLTDISERVVGMQLRQALLNRSPAVIVLMNHQRVCIEANDQFRSLFLPAGASIEQLDVRTLLVDETHVKEMANAFRRVYEAKTVRLDVPLRDVNGTVHWFDMHAVLQDPSDEVSPVIWTLNDISARHAADQALRIERLRLTTLLKRFPGGVLIEDGQARIVFVNESWCSMMGLRVSPQTLIGLARNGLEDMIGKQRLDWHEQSRIQAGLSGTHALEVEDERGHYLEIEHLDMTENDESLGAVWMVRDITDRKHNERRLQHLASTDPLTGLTNRRSFMQALNGLLHSPGRQSSEPAGVVLMLDIDHFKDVNDTYGHVDGDQVLKSLAAIFKDQVREHDLVARLGGEEFAIILPGVDASGGARIAERIRDAVQQSIIATPHAALRVTVSIGGAVATGSDPETVLRHSDQALYRAKQAGRNRVCILDS